MSGAHVPAATSVPLPSVDRLLGSPAFRALAQEFGLSQLTQALRQLLDQLRPAARAGTLLATELDALAMAAQLQIAAGDALLWVTRTAYLEDGAAVEYTQSYCRSDYYEFVAEMRKTP